MSLALYFAPGACSFVPHALLQASGAAFEPRMIKLHKGEQYGDEYKAINPRSQVPVLVDDGEVITQIVAIVNYLHEKFPASGFLPAQPLAKARVLEQLAWMNNSVHATFTHYFMPHKFSDNAAIHDDLRQHAVMRYRQHLADIESLAVKANAKSASFMAGAFDHDHLGPLDAYALTLLRWGTMAGINPEDYPVTWAHAQRLAVHTSVAPVIERERLQLSLYKPAA
jgi:glutathione S-transferase